ncbi:hypothetical protein SOVF_172650 [Spinacia oleracea]|uniref:Uncharacterized protein At5g65660 n=1 Tax=Spinacia oleracea TaxID=3562 RepID=A0A9R0IEG0_SPIOL|nr:uncharacterized protein At5g65660-like [Spinacia oleracea]KNA07356.1 hypothetical protein SOVF_172650 [Spinacia oleracea]
MGEGENWGWQPSGSPTTNLERSDVHWSHFDSSVNAVSFGFVATAVLISMFLVMAIFERFLRPSPPELPLPTRRDIESQLGFHPKLGYPSPKMTVYSQEHPVLMPGDNIPTFIAHPVPLPCPPDRIHWPPCKLKLPPKAPQSASRSTLQSVVREPI